MEYVKENNNANPIQKPFDNIYQRVSHCDMRERRDSDPRPSA